jgi:hypothetical protein
MGPLAEVAARGFGDLGDALGDALDRITRSEGTVEGLETLFLALSGTLRVVGHTLGWLGDRFHEFNVFQAKVFGDLEDINKALGLDAAAGAFAKLNDVFERMTGTGESLHGMFRKLGSEGVDPFADYLHRAWEEQERLRAETEASTRAIEDFWNQVRAATDADIAWERGLDNLTESVKENGTSLDITTEKGRRNIEAVEAAIEAAQRQYDANVKAGMSAQESGQRFAAEVQHLEDVAAAAGFSRSELEKLSGKYLITVAVAGANSIANAVLNAFYGRGGTATVTQRSSTAMGMRASGGPVSAGGAYLVGENGPEVLQMGSRNGYVHPNSAVMSGASGGSSKVVHEFNFTGDTNSWLLMAIENAIRTGQLKISSKAIVG